MTQRERTSPAAGAGAHVVALDALDRDIVALLMDDARQSVRAIARELGRSPGAIGERISRLESAGVITGYHADIDLSRLGYMHTMIGVRLVSDDSLDECVAAISRLEEIQLIWVVTGSWDVMAEAHLRDGSHLRELLREKLPAITGVQHTEAMIVLESASVAAPLAFAADENLRLRLAERSKDAEADPA